MIYLYFKNIQNYLNLGYYFLVFSLFRNLFYFIKIYIINCDKYKQLLKVKYIFIIYIIKSIIFIFIHH